MTSNPAWIKKYDFVGIEVLPNVNGLEMVLNAFNSTFKLKLDNYDRHLIFPGGELHIHDSDISSVFALEHNGLYDGLVYVPSRVESVGWARITHIGNDEYEGVFTTDVGMYHLKAISVYDKSRRENDAILLSPSARHLNFTHATHIIIKDRDSYLNQISDNSHYLSDVILEQKFREESGSPVFGINQCGVTNHFGKRNISQVSHFSKHNNLFKNLFKRAPEGCPTARKYIAMAAVADCSYYSVYQDASKVLNLILADWLAASKVYESSFNVILALSKVDILQTCTTDRSPNASPPPLTRWNQQCSSAYTIQNRLSDFSYWRGQQQDNFGLWHLMTNCPTQPSVGIAWVKTLCQREASAQDGEYTAGVGVSSIVPVEWKVVAHEIGHNFGAMHDCISSTCPAQCTAANPAQCSLSSSCRPCSPGCDCRGQFLMNPLDTSTTDMFSAFSIADICLEIQAAGACLLDEPPATVGAGICGNGVKESGEECDCGSDCATSRCCTSECKLKPGSACADENDSCCSGCQGTSTQCRPSNGACDPAEFCDGVNPECPKNVFATNGDSCNTLAGLSGQCASGQCTSRDIQCTGRGLINTAGACPAFYLECKLYCQDSSGNCLQFNGNFIDGTPCGDTGRCVNGACTGQNEFGEIIGWYRRNLSLAIPITITVLGGLLMILWAGISRCIRNARTRREQNRRSSSYQQSSPSTYAQPSTRNSVLSSNNNNAKAPPYPDPAPVYESQELLTIRNATAPDAYQTTTNQQDWGLQPFSSHQPVDYSPLPLPTPSHQNDWTGLEWIDDKNSNLPKN